MAASCPSVYEDGDDFIFVGAASKVLFMEDGEVAARLSKQDVEEFIQQYLLEKKVEQQRLAAIRNVDKIRKELTSQSEYSRK